MPLFSGQDGHGVDLRKDAALLFQCFRQRGALANQAANLSQDGPKPLGGRALGQQVQRAKDRNSSLDQCVELLIEDQEVIAVDGLLALAAEQLA